MEQEFDRPVEYAGFWLRFAASIIDGLIIGAVVYIILLILIALGIGVGGMFSEANMAEENQEAFIMAIIAAYLGFVTFAFIGGWLYYALMQSGPKQATIGKMAVGIKVTTLEGHRISFLNATGRYFSRIISSMILYIGFIMAGFTEKKQALHDMIASTLVVRSR